MEKSKVYILPSPIIKLFTQKSTKPPEFSVTQPHPHPPQKKKKKEIGIILCKNVALNMGMCHHMSNSPFSLMDV